MNARVFDSKTRGYDPNQPRDEGGRWTDGGGVASSRPQHPVAPEPSSGSFSGNGPRDARDPAQVLESIPRGKQLSEDDRRIESQFAERIAANVPAAKEAYAKLPGTSDGRILNVDTARELEPAYLEDRTKSAAVHEPASWLVKDMYEDRLAEPPKPGQDNKVLMMAGGTGAGKSTAVTETMADQFSRAQVIYDSNLSSVESSSKKIEQALAAGKDVQIAYIYRDPIVALKEGALSRAMNQERKYGTGRTVPMEEHIKTHVGANTTVRELAARYADNKRVEFRVIDNSDGRGGARMSNMAAIPRLDYNSTRERAFEALEAARASGQISESVYNGFAGRPASKSVRASKGLGRPACGQSQPQRERSSRNAVVRLARDFDPSQPRDSTGRWTGDGSGAQSDMFGPPTPAQFMEGFRQGAPEERAARQLPSAQDVFPAGEKFNGRIVHDWPDDDERKALTERLSELREQLSGDRDEGRIRYPERGRIANVSATYMADGALEAIEELSDDSGAFFARAVDEKGVLHGMAAGHDIGGFDGSPAVKLDYLASFQPGAGSKLLSDFEDWAATNGAERVILNSTSYARPFYASHGYNEYRDDWFEKNVGEKALRAMSARDEPVGALTIPTGKPRRPDGEEWTAYSPSAVKRIVRFNPDQPRDEQGQWTDSGGSGSGGSSSQGSSGSPAAPSQPRGHEHHTPKMAAKLDEIEGRIHSNDRETGAAVDAQGNVLVERTGKPDQLRLGPDELLYLHQNAIRGDVTFTHNHPGGASFSEDDIKFAATQGIREIRACTSHGTFTLRRVGSNWPKLYSYSDVREPSYEKAVKQAIADTGGTLSLDTYHYIWARYAQAIPDQIAYEYIPKEAK